MSNDTKRLTRVFAILFLTQFLIFSGLPQWVGTKIIGLPLTGGTMQGDIDMGNNDIHMGTGLIGFDGTASEGFSFDTSGNITFEATTGSLILPLSNDATTPTLVVDGGTSGLYAAAANNLRIAIGGAEAYKIDTNNIRSATSGGFFVTAAAATATVPSLAPSNADPDSGVVHDGADRPGMGSGAVTAQIWDETGGIITHERSGLTTRFTSEAVADDAEILLATGVSGWGQVMAGDNEEWAHFRFSADGTVTLITNTANVVNTDTDTKFCIYDAGSGIGVKNRLGSSKTVAFTINYY